MRILLVQESDWLTKGPHPQHHLMEKFSLRGHEIRVIDFEVLWKTQGKKELLSRRQVYHDISKIYKGSKITVIRPGIMKLRIPGIDYLSLIFSHEIEIKRQIREFRPDAIISLGILNSYLSMRAARKNNILFVYHWLDLYHTLIPIRQFRPIGKLVEQRTLRQSDVVLATNKRLRDRLVEMGAPPEKTSVLPHGIDFNRFDPNLVDRSKIRKQYGIKSNDIVMAFVGRLSRITGVREVALELSEIDNHNLKFLIIGTGTRENELRQLQQELNLKERLIITGRMPFDDIPALLAASDICLLPYWEIPMTEDIVPLKIFDYMAMGKPVISTSLRGMEVEFSGVDGMFFVKTPRDVVKKSIELAARGNLTKLGANLRNFVEGNDWNRITDKLEMVLDEVITRKKTE